MALPQENSKFSQDMTDSRKDYPMKQSVIMRRAYPDISALRTAIPPHCFLPSTWKSCIYLARDLSLVGILLICGILIPNLSSPALRILAWTAYSYIQGLAGTGLWILAHECGHGAFSVHKRFNDLIGWTIHSMLLVPYFSWKSSHARHHRYSGHIKKDMAFVPKMRKEYLESQANAVIHDGIFDDTPILMLVLLILHQTLGWPMYLFFNTTAGPESLKREDTKAWWKMSHFDPTSAIFGSDEIGYILLSDLGLALMLGCLSYGGMTLGWKTVFLLYFLPYVWIHHWLVAITYLHHTHSDVPHYEDYTWTYTKGALSTIDRDFGIIGRHMFHGIIETHVVHHLFPNIPFYHAEEATRAIQPLLGDLYHRDSAPFMRQLWRTFKKCKWVESNTENSGEQVGVLYWNK